MAQKQAAAMTVLLVVMFEIPKNHDQEYQEGQTVGASLTLSKFSAA